jgi:hypothetical protein
MSAIANLVALLIFDLRARWRPRRTQHQAGTDTGLGVMVVLAKLPLPLATSMTACGQVGAQVRADGTMQPRMMGLYARWHDVKYLGDHLRFAEQHVRRASEPFAAQKNVFAGGGSRQRFANCPGRWQAPRRLETS